MCSTTERKIWRRLCVVGFPGVGKSALTNQFASRRFENEYCPTVEDTITKTVSWNGKKYELEVVDTAGMDECCFFDKHYAVGVHGYILVFSVTSRHSLEKLKQVHEKIVNAWGTSSVPMVVVGTKADLQKERRVSADEARALAAEWDCAYVECSNKLNYHVDDVFSWVLAAIEKEDAWSPSSSPRSSGDELSPRGGRDSSSCVVA